MLELYNTASGKLEAPSWGQSVSIYVCGITPYDSAHMGHVFTFATYDILQRYLEHKGHEVCLVRNITDVDEPIYVKAAQLGIPYTQLAAEETERFQSVMQQLNLRQPYNEPRASQYIEQMADAVQQLLQSGNAYELANGDIYFDVSTDKNFGLPAHLSHDLQLAFMADRGGDPRREDKHNPLDFLLWKAISDPGDPAAWDTPVGHGRPGWHIECSIMSSELLGTPIDLHGGGMDLIFPHHACEKAQSNALGADPFVKHWMHVAPMLYQGEKMSKSLGNLVFAKDLLEHYEPAVIRLALLEYHYRIGGEWHNDALVRAKDQLKRIRAALDAETGPDPTPYLQRFYEALDEDLDTPEALHCIMQFACDKSTAKPGAAQADALRTMLAILGIQSD